MGCCELIVTAESHSITRSPSAWDDGRQKRYTTSLISHRHYPGWRSFMRVSHGTLLHRSSAELHVLLKGPAQIGMTAEFRRVRS